MAQIALQPPPDELRPPPPAAAPLPGPSTLALAPNSNIEPMTFAQADDGLSFSELVKQRIDKHIAAAGFVKEVAKLVHPFTPVGIGESIGKDLAERPGEFAPVFNAAERQTRLVDNMFGKDASIEEAYDRRIKAVKDATGITLENPERGGYGLTERELRRLSQDEPIDPTAYRRLTFEGKLRALREAHPDKTEALSFGDIQKESEAIAHGAEQEYERARADTTLSGPSSFAMQAGGAMWGMRRDPLFVGSLFAGPTSAVGKEVGTRIATSALFQGLYNAGITALEQPSVQAWRAEIGAKSGVVPALENVGVAFLTGVIPGAILRGIHEELSAVARRVLTSREPLPGDIEKLTDAVTSAISPTSLADRLDAEFKQRLKTHKDEFVYTEEGTLGSSLQAVQGYNGDPVRLAKAAAWGAKNDRLDIAARARQVAQAFGDSNTVQQIDRIVEFQGGSLDDVAGSLLTPQDRAAIRVGEAMDEADRVANPPPTPNVAPELREDLKAAALRQADDPYNSPSPEGVAALNHIEVFHGSPHDFEAFDIGKIGTGEGAQSYGHGLYFAENRGVAESYRTKLDQSQATARGFLQRNNGDKAAALAEWDDAIARSTATLTDAEKADNASVRAEIANGGKGGLYTARIKANREHFMDYDKPLSEQSPYVLDRLAAIAESRVPGAGEKLRASSTKAGDWLDTMADVGENRAAFSRELAQAGIPGIKYLDQGSRGSGDGSRNFVVFDDKLVDITHKNDVALSPKMQEVADRVAEAQPRSLKEAQMAASEAIEEQGTKATATRLRTELDAPAYTLEESFDLGSKAPLAPRSSKDPLDKIPLPDDDGTFRMKSAQDIARVGERETQLGDLIRACK